MIYLADRRLEKNSDEYTESIHGSISFATGLFLAQNLSTFAQ